MKKLALLLLMMPALYGQAQKKHNPAPYAKTIKADDLKKHLYIVAGEEMGGREATTEGERKAAAYIINEFSRIGLVPGNNGSYQQFFPVYQDSLISSSLVVNGKEFAPGKDFLASPQANYTATLMGSEVVFAGNGIVDSTRNDYKDINANGKIVLVIPQAAPANGAPRQRRGNPYAIQDAAMKNGAAAVLVVQGNFPRQTNNNLGSMTMNGYRSTIYPNAFMISEEVAKAIMGEDFKSAKEGLMNTSVKDAVYKANVKMQFEKHTNVLQSSNIVGLIEGTDLKDEYVVLTAHYDHVGKRGDSVIYYGADDDGSGTVSLIEFAEAFQKAKKDGKGPRRSIVIMAVSGEEKGLWGSGYYGDNPLFPLEKTTVNLNTDMIGRIDPKRKVGDSTNYVYVVGDDKLSTDLRTISEAMNKKHTKLELDYKFNDPNDTERIYYRSDHYNFARRGVPIIFYFNGTHADYHRPTDTPDKINYDLMEKRARFIFHTAWEMANRNDMLKRDIPLPKAF